MLSASPAAFRKGATISVRGLLDDCIELLLGREVPEVEVLVPPDLLKALKEKTNLLLVSAPTVVI